MKKTFRIILMIMLLLALVSPLTVKAVKAYSGIPTFSIVSVEKNTSVTIKTNNFPAGDTYTVTMGPYGKPRHWWCCCRHNELGEWWILYGNLLHSFFAFGVISYSHTPSKPNHWVFCL